MSFNAEDFNRVVEKYHLALGEFMKGNPAPAKELYSQRDDVTLGNPFGPFARGWQQVVETMEKAASNYRDGDATGFICFSAGFWTHHASQFNARSRSR